MRTWTRAAGDMLCGFCPRYLRRGDPIQLQRTPGVKRAFVRCATCAGEPVPDDLPSIESQTAIAPTVNLPSGPNALPFDFKAAGAGEDIE
jgi:hypothetical protein